VTTTSIPLQRQAEADPEDSVAVSSDESFPASDPPAFTATHAGPPGDAGADGNSSDRLPGEAARRPALKPSIWMELHPLAPFAPLDQKISADVVVVGAGATGLTTACLLAEAGLSVVVLERDRIAAVDTGHTTAHLTMVTDARLAELTHRLGEPHARAIWEAGMLGLAEIRRCVDRFDIDCDLETVPGDLRVRPDDGTAPDEVVAELRREAAPAEQLGLRARFEPAVPVWNTPGVRFPGQARIHPLRYLEGLVRAALSLGVRIHEESAAERFHDEPLRVETRNGIVACDHVVLATHNPLMGVAGHLGPTLLQTKLSLRTSYVVAAHAPRGTVPDALFWDTGDPYRYLRMQPAGDHDLLIFGGEDHKTGQADDGEERYARLEAALAGIVPEARPVARWSGQVIATPDGLPYIGPITPQQFIATGFNGNGITFGTLAARMAVAHVLGHTHPWADLFSIDRKALRHGLWNYLTENADFPYHLIHDRLTGAEADSLRAVPPGSGRIVDLRGTKVAAARDESGRLTVRSAVCTHLGCIVAWNDSERTWDCPCHGSRFHPDGRVIAGPAERPLAALSASADDE